MANIFQNLAKEIGRGAQKFGKAIPGLVVGALNAQSGGAVGMIAEALGIPGAPDDVILSHIQKNPEASVDQIIEMQAIKQKELEALIADRKDARAQYKEMLASTDPVVRRWLVALSVILLGILCWLFWVGSQPLAAGETRPQIIDLVIGTFLGYVSSMISFWFSTASTDQAHRQQKERER